MRKTRAKTTARVQVVEKPFARTMQHKEAGFASEEFTSTFEIRENTAKSNPIHGFQ